MILLLAPFHLLACLILTVNACRWMRSHRSSVANDETRFACVMIASFTSNGIVALSLPMFGSLLKAMSSSQHGGDPLSIIGAVATSAPMLCLQQRFRRKAGVLLMSGLTGLVGLAGLLLAFCQVTIIELSEDMDRVF